MEKAPEKRNTAPLRGLYGLPDGSVLSVIGAGGKTTSILHLAQVFRAQGRRVLVVTTTHMQDRPDRLEREDEIRRALRTDGFAYAGTRVERNGAVRMAPLPEEVLLRLMSDADVTLIEADGSRRLPFKVPKTTEPVIHGATTAVLLIAGMSAAGRPIGEVSYNAGALCRVLTDAWGRPVAEEETLTPEAMAEAYRLTYVKDLRGAGWRLQLLPAVPGDDAPENDAPENDASGASQHAYPAGLPGRRPDGSAKPLYLMAGQLTDAERVRLGGRFLAGFAGEAEEDRRFFTPVRIWPVLLAAGYSSRFSGNKLLAPCGGKPMVQCALENLTEACGGRTETEAVTVVTQYPEIIAMAGRFGAEAVVNPDPSRGISSSIRVGCGAAETRAVSRGAALSERDYLVFFTGDMPDLHAGTIRKLFDALCEKRPRLAAVSFGGQFGIPAAFRADLLPEIRTLTGDRGGKSLLRAHRDELLLVGAEPGELADYDTAEELAARKTNGDVGGCPPAE